jgi:hypothetical protein
MVKIATNEQSAGKRDANAANKQQAEKSPIFHLPIPPALTKLGKADIISLLHYTRIFTAGQVRL